QSQRIHPLLLHWDGTQWQRVTVGLGRQLQGVGLIAVSADSATDAWAVGQRLFGHGNRRQPAVALHWDGSTWTAVPVPARGVNEDLLGVWTASPTDAVAVGDAFVKSEGKVVTLTMHWDGASWTVVPSPSPVQGFDSLRAVSGRETGSVWAVGQ